MVYALLPNKSRHTYIKLFQEIKNLQPGIQPRQIMTDFEQSAIQAFQIEFPGILNTGCFFHLYQSVWRKVQDAGLKQKYQNDHEFARWIRMILAIAFIPLAGVIVAFVRSN